MTISQIFPKTSYINYQFIIVVMCVSLKYIENITLNALTVVLLFVILLVQVTLQ